MPRNTFPPVAVEAMRKALEQLVSKPKHVTERELIETHKDLIQRALDRGYDFKDIAGVAEAVGVVIPIARFRKYYQDVQGIPRRTRKKQAVTVGEDGSSTEVNGNGAAPAPIINIPAVVEVEQMQPAPSEPKPSRRRSSSTRSSGTRSTRSKSAAQADPSPEKGTAKTGRRKKTS